MLRHNCKTMLLSKMGASCDVSENFETCIKEKCILDEFVSKLNLLLLFDENNFDDNNRKLIFYTMDFIIIRTVSFFSIDVAKI